MREELTADHRVYLALVDDSGLVVGYGGLLAVGADADIQTIAVVSAARGSGNGRRLMEAIIDCARDRLYRSVVGEVLANNEKMLKLMARLGFAILPHPESNDLKRVVKPLRD